MIPLFITSSFSFLFNKKTKAWWIGLIIALIVLAVIAFATWLIVIGQGLYLLVIIPVFMFVTMIFD